MTEESPIRFRINKRGFREYYKIALRKYGSQRRIAREVGVSHTLIGKILDDRHKTHVNLDTALRFEEFFSAPSNILFVPEAVPVTGKAVAA